MQGYNHSHDSVRVFLVDFLIYVVIHFCDSVGSFLSGIESASCFIVY